MIVPPLRPLAGRALLASLLLAPGMAHAGELTWEGFYRGRGLLYDSLSLSTANPNAEGTSTVFDHRLDLRPSWLISEHAAVHAQLDVLAWTTWGGNPATYTDPLTDEPIATAQADGVSPVDGEIQATRAWAEAYTPIGRFAMGRMPMQWGAGILWNAGLDPLSEYGDTADRVQFTTRAGPVFVMGAWDLHSEGFVGEWDDMAAASLAIGFRNETAGVGLLNNYRYQVHPDARFQAYTGDLWGYSELGPLRLELEAVGVFGGGDLNTGANDISIMAFGAMLDAGWQGEKLGLGVQGGLATGDADPTDAKLRTFSFDRDHNVALMLFEEPMPTLAAAVPNETNEGRDYGAALTGDGVSNALYLRPSARYEVLPGLVGEVAWITGALAKGPANTEGRKGFGHEFDLSVRYDPVPHVWAQGTVGLLIPGPYYSGYEHEDLGGDFDAPAIGARLVGTVEF